MDEGSELQVADNDLGTWVTLDIHLRHASRLGTSCVLVSCRRHGVIVASVPWARHNAGHTRDFDDTVAWLATVTEASRSGGPS